MEPHVRLGQGKEEFWVAFLSSKCIVTVRSIRMAIYSIQYQNINATPKRHTLGQKHTILPNRIEKSVYVWWLGMTPAINFKRYTKKPQHVTCHVFAEVTHHCGSTIWICMCGIPTTYLNILRFIETCWGVAATHPILLWLLASTKVCTTIQVGLPGGRYLTGPSVFFWYDNSVQNRTGESLKDKTPVFILTSLK